MDEPDVIMVRLSETSSRGTFGRWTRLAERLTVAE